MRQPQAYRPRLADEGLTPIRAGAFRRSSAPTQPLFQASDFSTCRNFTTELGQTRERARLGGEQRGTERLGAPDGRGKRFHGQH
jgi:hypothetical protein